ncbi:MAG: hypothetical protein HRT88_03065 [Lentisphaeraceae bacterium]|nr:hypothetical protein [Lentisphaeraceae bacterium]
MDLLWEIFFWGFITCSFVALLAGLLFLFLIYRSKQCLDEIVTGDAQVLEEKFCSRQKVNPQLSDLAIIEKMINTEARNSGIIGFLTGVGGLAFLPIALPADIIGTLRIQSRLIEFISMKLGHAEVDSRALKMKQYAMLAGSQQAGNLAGKLILKMTLRFAPKIILESIPIIGGVVGYLIDSMSTKAIGKLLLKQYSPDKQENTLIKRNDKQKAIKEN